jgi:adenosylcobinamide-phosphate synthase
MSIALASILGVILDALLGEPKRWHPLVGFGRLASRIERWLYRPSRAAGVLALCALLVPATLAAALLARLPLFGWVSAVGLLYLAIGHRSLREHARAVADALDAGDLAQAQQCVARMVSRDTGQMQDADVARATVESVLENGNDALFGAVFWFAVAGAPGVVLYRLANTLDAMWGYRTDRYLHFGWAAARLDDALNFVPARLTALSYALCGRFADALACWRVQAPAWDSPNAGPVMAAGAGALGIELGGPAKYAGQWHLRPALGVGRGANAQDIDAALELVRDSLWLWLGIVLLLGASAKLLESFHA